MIQQENAALEKQLGQKGDETMAMLNNEEYKKRMKAIGETRQQQKSNISINGVKVS